MAQKKWDSSNIEDQKGRVAIVTGSSSGIGFETARVLANKNAEVVLAIRNTEKGEKALQKILAQNHTAKVKIMQLDLANLQSVKKFAVDFKQEYDRLDLLINNAGVMMPPNAKTENGFELQFGTNHLGHFALTLQLLDLMKRTSDSRIVNVSSNMHKRGNIDFDDLNWEKRKYNPMQTYADSKIANIYFTYELGTRIGNNGKNPIIAAAHPGWTATELQRHTGLFEFLNHFFAQDITIGALPTLYAAVAPDVQNGDYFGPSGLMEMKGYPKKTDTNLLSKDKKIAEKLWHKSEELTGVTYHLD